MRIAGFGFTSSVVVALTVGCGGTGTSTVDPSARQEVTPTDFGTVGACARKKPGSGAGRLGDHREGGAVALARSGDGTIAYVADEDDRSVHTIDVSGGRARATTRLSGAPARVLVLADGRVAVTLRDKNRLQVFEPGGSVDEPLQALCSVKTPVEPVGLAATPDDATIVVASAWARKLTGYAADTMAVRFNNDVLREPRDVVVDDSGQRAFVAHVVGGKVSVVDLEPDADAREIDLRVPNTAGSTAASSTRQSCQGFALAKSVAAEEVKPRAVTGDGADSGKALTTQPRVPGGRIFAPRVTIDPGEPMRRSSGYGNSRFSRIETPIVSVIDAKAERNLTTALHEVGSRSVTPTGACLLPRAAAVSAATGGLLVACAGTDALVELDTRGTDPARLERRRWKVPAGPVGVAVNDEEAIAVVWSQFDRQLAVVDLASASETVDVIPAPKPLDTSVTATVAWGRKLFHQTDDTRISRDGRACASCHPDGREDALTWSTPVGPRQTIMLAGRLKGSAPFSWLGVHENERVHLRTTFQRLGGSGLPEKAGRADEMDALVSYLHAMPAPHLDDALVDEEQVALAKQGRALFHAEETGCAKCHVGGGTDAKTYDLGTKSAGDKDDKFDTPSLKFVGGTAPYFHDGRYETLLDLLTSTDSQMGHTMHLSRRDALALTAYMETL